MSSLLKFLAFLCCTSATLLVGAEKPNVLFIAIDDLRPELGCYGSPIAKSPNLDALAAEGLRFDRAYCQEAICAPSRASLLTGARPDTTGITHNYVKIRELNPDIITLPQHFKSNGYETVYFGKIYHQGDPDDRSWSLAANPKLIDVPKPKGGYALPENNQIKKDNMAKMIAKYGEAAKKGLGSGPAYESADVPDTAYGDGYNTALAIATMKKLVREDDQPFFLALGLNKPHLNWTAPKKYWDMYDRDDIELSPQVDGPENGAEMGLHASFELRTRHGIPKSGPLGEDLSHTLLHAYYACVSYVDAQIGKMIAAVDEAGIRDNTIIIVWSDHGWHLGEMGIWGKATNYEIGTRVPLIVWTPDMKANGKATDALVELVDIFPTLCELAGIPQADHLDGSSFAPLLDKPNRSWKELAISQFPSPALSEWAANPLSPGMRETFFGPLIEEVEGRIIDQQGDAWDRDLFENHLMGYTARSEKYRLVLWKDHRDPFFRVSFRTSKRARFIFKDRFYAGQMYTFARNF
jgi:iduronate 2-sulfatase